MCDENTETRGRGRRISRSKDKSRVSKSPQKSPVKSSRILTPRNALNEYDAEEDSDTPSPPLPSPPKIKKKKRRRKFTDETLLTDLKLQGYSVAEIGGNVLIKQVPSVICKKLKRSNGNVKLLIGTSKIKSRSEKYKYNFSTTDSDSDVENGRPCKKQIPYIHIPQYPIDFQSKDEKLRMGNAVAVKRIPTRVLKLLKNGKYVDLVDTLPIKPKLRTIPPEYLKRKALKLGHECKTPCGSSVIPIPDNLKHEASPLALPYYFGWTRGKHSTKRQQNKYGSRIKHRVYYMTPCRKEIVKYADLMKFITTTRTPLQIDNFCFQPKVKCLVELPKSSRASFFVFEEDISNGQELRKVERVNSLDLEPASALEYIANSVFGPNVNIDDDLAPKYLTCCDCEDDCRDKTKCNCWKLTMENEAVLHPKSVSKMDNTVGYNNQKKLLKKVDGGIFECNSGCKCKSSCINRIVQKGLCWRLQVYKTKTKGYAVRAMEEIPKGSFVCIYAGELIKSVDADKVGTTRGTGYAVDLDLIGAFEDKHTIGIQNKILTPLQATRQRLLLGPEDEKFVVDAKRKGNVGRYFNHSCRPNLFVQPVFAFNHDLRLPCAALFTSEVIKCGVELAWDYGYESTPGYEKACYCGSSGCKKRML